MSFKENKINVYTTTSGAELNISAPEVKKVINATNNKAQYFAEMAKKYRDEAKQFREEAKNFSEQNSDVTIEHLNKLKESIEWQLATKQNSDNYALRKEVPSNVSELNNDMSYVTASEMAAAVSELELPSLENCSGMFLQTNGEEVFWAHSPKMNLFDTIFKDHVLTYEESKGLALQGTYVYKEALAGSRYGYPDFYNKCLEEFQDSEEFRNYLSQDIEFIGNTINNDWNISNFSTSNYVKVNKNLLNAISTTSTFEIVTKITTGSDVTTRQHIFTQGCSQSSLGYNAIGIDMLDGKFNALYSYAQANQTTAGSHTILPNTEYYLKLEFTGSELNLYYALEKDNWILDATKATITKLQSSEYNFLIGVWEQEANGSLVYPFLGSIDLKETYINIDGVEWFNPLVSYSIFKNSNGHMFYDISNKEFIDELLDLNGSAWFYGVDTDNERIFLPRNNYFEQLTGKVSEVGQSVEAGLPNITGGFDSTNYNAIREYGAFYNGGASSNSDGNTGTTSNSFHNVDFNASLSNLIYGNSNTVQPPAVKKLLYICVGNTTSYEGVTDVVNQGMEILEQVNQGITEGITQGIETRVKLDGSNAEFPYVTETYKNGASWYRVYSDGWCEQGGLVPSVSSTSTQTITFLKPFINTSYSISKNVGTSASDGVSYRVVSFYNKTITGATTYVNTGGNGVATWEAKGYIA